MARFITIFSSGAGLAGGNFLVNVDDIVSVNATAGVTTKIVGTTKTTTLTHTTTGTMPSVRDAINNALTANPGGVNAKVALPTGITVSVVATAS